MNKQQESALMAKTKMDTSAPSVRVNAREIARRFRELQQRRSGIYESGRFGRMGLKREGGWK